MPLTGPVSFLPVAEELSAHWAGVDSSLGARGPLKLHGTIGRGALADLKARMEKARESVAKIRHTRESERHDLAALDELLDRRLGQFNEVVSVKGRKAETYESAAALWLELEKFGKGFQLPKSYDRLDFVTDLSARKLVSTALAAAERALAGARGSRDSLFDQLYGFLELYRETILELFAADSPEVLSLPKLGLPRGQLPEAVTAAVRWENGMARLSWSNSDEPDLARYEVRVVPGSTYETEDETLVAVVEADGPRQIDTEAELSEPGLTATYRVYVVLGSSQERGSHPVTVTRS